MGHGHGLGHGGQAAGFQFVHWVELAIGQPGDAGQRAGGHVDEQLVPHRAHDVVADRGLQPGSGEHGGNALRPLGHLAVQFANVRVLAAGADGDVAGPEHQPAYVGLARQHFLTAHGCGQHLFMAQAVLQRQHHRVRADQASGGRHGLRGVK